MGNVGFGAKLKPGAGVGLNGRATVGVRRFNLHKLDGTYICTVRAGSKAEALELGNKVHPGMTLVVK